MIATSAIGEQEERDQWPTADHAAELESTAPRLGYMSRDLGGPLGPPFLTSTLPLEDCPANEANVPVWAGFDPRRVGGSDTRRKRTTSRAGTYGCGPGT